MTRTSRGSGVRCAGAVRGGARALLHTLLLLPLLFLLLSPPAVAGTVEGTEETSQETSQETSAAAPLVAVELAWAGDSAEEFAERLGSPAALYAVEVHLPLTGAASVDLHNVALQAAAQGSGLVLTVKPHAGLEGYDETAARTTALAIGQATEPVEGPVLVRFGPQMNTPWVAWGMQPTAYVEAFRATTEALREEVPDALTVWSPQTLEGYPFPMDGSSPALRAAAGAGTDAALDTNGNGLLDRLDDAYSPFYPGDEWVDWVGLSALYDPAPEPGQATPIPDTDLARQMLGRAEGSDPTGFYQRYAVARDRPLLLDTGAAYRGGDGPTAGEVKAAWWDQVLRLHAEGYDRLGATLWHDLAHTDTTGRWVTQRLTGDPATTQIFRSKVELHGARLGPVAVPADVGDLRTHGTVLDRRASWTVVVGVLAAVLLLWAASRWVPPVRSLAYVQRGRRDLRVDLLRGLAITFVVVDHLGLTSLFHLVSQEAIGIVSGAELFVVLAGVILGIVSRPRMAVGMFEAVDRGWSRARKLYLWALLVPLTVFGLSHVPWLDTTAVTTYSTPFDGPVSSTTPPSTYDLFAGLDGLLRYPAEPSVVPRLLGLQFGPWQFNILGLYVILLLVSPFVLHALHRGKGISVLLVSVALYLVSQASELRILPFQSSDAFPILAWQLLFVLGLAAGFFWREILLFVRTSWGQALLVVCCLAAAGFMLLSWSNPFLSNVYDVRLSLLPDQQFYALYAEWFGRTWLRPGRLLNVIVLVVALFALLTALWKPIDRLLGWLLVPLGEATLYVFIVHVFLIIIVTNVPLVAFGNVWLNTAAYVVVLLVLNLMVRTKFLGGILPR